MGKITFKCYFIIFGGKVKWCCSCFVVANVVRQLFISPSFFSFHFSVFFLPIILHFWCYHFCISDLYMILTTICVLVSKTRTGNMSFSLLLLLFVTGVCVYVFLCESSCPIPSESSVPRKEEKKQNMNMFTYNGRLT